MNWDTKKVIGVAVVVGALSQIGNGLKAVSWLVGVPDAAYGGQATAQKVDEEFKEYLNAQKASTEAIRGYIAAQQQPPPIPTNPLPAPRTPPVGHPGASTGHSSIDTQELSDDGEIKVMRWTDEQGTVRTMCCQGTDCWPWYKATQCAQ